MSGHDPKFFSSNDRKTNIAFGTSYNNNPNNPLAKKAREYRKNNPSISRDKAFDLAERDLINNGYTKR